MKNKKLFIYVIICCLLFVISAYTYNHFYHKSIKSKPIFYCYQTYFGPANSVLIIEDLSYKKELVQYYNEMSKGINPVFNFPLKTLPQKEPVYVIGYTDDSTLAEIVSYYDRGRHFGGSFLKGYVDIRTLHKEPPK